jgi:hypothetical protein
VFLTGTASARGGDARRQPRDRLGHDGRDQPKLKPAMAELVRGRNPKHRDWCAPVYREDAKG